MKIFRQSGFILVTVMIFLALLSLIALRELNDGIMQLHILHTWQRHQQLFLNAEKLLAQGERKLKNSCQSVDACVSVKQTTADSYQVTATIKENGNSVVLQSIYRNKIGRLSWKEISE